jgi:signal transduction histidine kinase
MSISEPPPSPPGAQARCDADSDDRKRSFLRMVSHELRTPLNSIIGFSEILSSELLGPLGSAQYKEYAEIIRGSGQKLLKLVNQVLELARLEARVVELEIRPEPLEDAIDDVLDLLDGEIEGRGLRLKATGPDPLPDVLVDGRALRTVLGNLVQNAVTFSPDGGEVRIGVELGGDWVEIVIEDEGQGVAPEDLPRLLRPFEQGENPLARRGEGAALALVISELTCDLMNGRMSLHSDPGAGLCVRVRLPSA